MIRALLLKPIPKIGFIYLFILFFFPKNEMNAQCQFLDTLGIELLQDSLVMNFPDICKKITIGTSVTGREIVAMKFSDNVNVDENEPEILLTTGLLPTVYFT